MSGSPLTAKHVAAKMCSDLGVTVATPQLRLAPENPYPAALDDLKAAYAFLRQHGVDPAMASAPPLRVALYAENSGGALALSLVHALIATDDLMPCAMAMCSPWLDLTCENGSFTVNESCDPVMRKDKLHGIAKAYLGGAALPSDPIASPLLAPSSAFALPPTLVHVSRNELLLDDSLILEEKCRSAGADVSVKEWARVLHGWHTFFPVMPAALQAVDEVVDFLRKHLFP